MSVMREYQQKMLESNSKIVVCNWDRGSGKTYAIVNKILKNGGSWKFICLSCGNKSRIIEDSINQIEKEYKANKNKRLYDEIHINENIMRIILNKEYAIENGVTREIKIFFTTKENCFIKSCSIDYLVFDDEENFDLEILKYEKEATNYKQIFITMSNKCVEFISEKYNYISETEWIDNQIKELMDEFSSINKNERTTITRGKILDMIKDLNNLRSKIIT